MQRYVAAVICKNFLLKGKRCVKITMYSGSGKTFVIFLVIVNMYASGTRNFLIVVTSDFLAGQMRKDMHALEKLLPEATLKVVPMKSIKADTLASMGPGVMAILDEADKIVTEGIL